MQGIPIANRVIVLLIAALGAVAFHLPAIAHDSPLPMVDKPISEMRTIDVGNAAQFGLPTPRQILKSKFKTRPEIERARCEIMYYKLAEARAYPLVGQARLVQVHYKLTVTSGERTEVSYIDETQLVRER